MPKGRALVDAGVLIERLSSGNAVGQDRHDGRHSHQQHHEHAEMHDRT
jgi:hypothetical protein